MSMIFAGGMLPLSATLATNSCFEAFQHESKLKALLHGHSYTAHAIGCSAANTALDMYTDPACNSNLQKPSGSSQTEGTCLIELWEDKLVDQLSRHERVHKLVVLGKYSQQSVCHMSKLACSETASLLCHIDACLLVLC